MPRFARYLILALMAMPATLSAAPSDPTASSPEPSPPSLKGELLVATPAMRDPRFDHAVILMVSNDRDGAFGIVINDLLGEKPVADILTALGKKDVAATGNVPVFLGGPVEPEVSFTIHGADYHRPETRGIDARLAITPSIGVLEDIARKQGPAKSLIAFGYAGWAAGQLESELAHNVWYAVPADPGIVFDDDRDKVWEHAIARHTEAL